jgi:hypothetical protein
MDKEFDAILDECIDRLSRGESVEACLADYPVLADRLKPVLLTMAHVQHSLAFSPSDNALRSGRDRLYSALEKKHQSGFWQRMLGSRNVWVTTAAVLIVALIAYFGLQTLGLPGKTPGGQIAQPAPNVSPLPTANSTPEPPSQYIAAANPAGNFAFLVSDEVNAIADFSSVDVVIERIGILQSGDSGKWLEFTPVLKKFDLSLLPGDKSLELWRGDIPAGQYNKVFIQVSGVTGILKSTGKTLAIKLPSDKLQMSLPFEVGTNAVTSFTYDLTVIKTGSDNNAGKYLLKPQIGESGARQSQD